MKVFLPRGVKTVSLRRSTSFDAIVDVTFGKVTHWCAELHRRPAESPHGSGRRTSSSVTLIICCFSALSPSNALAATGGKVELSGCLKLLTWKSFLLGGKHGYVPDDESQIRSARRGGDGVAIASDGLADDRRSQAQSDYQRRNGVDSEVLSLHAGFSSAE